MRVQKADARRRLDARANSQTRRDSVEDCPWWVLRRRACFPRARGPMRGGRGATGTRGRDGDEAEADSRAVRHRIRNLQANADHIIADLKVQNAAMDAEIGQLKDVVASLRAQLGAGAIVRAIDEALSQDDGATLVTEKVATKIAVGIRRDMVRNDLRMQGQNQTFDDILRYRHDAFLAEREEGDGALLQVSVHPSAWPDFVVKLSHPSPRRSS